MCTISVNLITVGWSIGCNKKIFLISFAILLNSYVLWIKEIINYLGPVQKREKVYKNFKLSLLITETSE